MLVLQTDSTEVACPGSLPCVWCAHPWHAERTSLATDGQCCWWVLSMIQQYSNSCCMIQQYSNSCKCRLNRSVRSRVMGTCTTLSASEC